MALYMGASEVCEYAYGRSVAPLGSLAKQ